LNTGAQEQKLSKAEIDSMVADDRYWKDPAYREQVEKKIRTTYNT